MKYSEFEDIISSERMHRYLIACNNDSRKAMTLYRYNIKLSQELLAVVGCFEVALRNKINKQFTAQYGGDWLRDFILPQGVFYSDNRVTKTKNIIEKAYNGLMRSRSYTHTKLLSEMEFGIWKYMFSNVQYHLTQQTLLSIFPNKPRSTPAAQYDNTYIFVELDYINNLRNRIAHHEPICFGTRANRTSIDTFYALNRYSRIITLFNWLGIDSPSLLYGLGDVVGISNKISSL
ncbi:MAG: Abi family protein [Muribaculaceae bacterium]|nr:Abi family protein [Muribaculaceae bacterium]MDE6702590.1 Abi family protein [Muribaculaceae bacterium]